jgi:hypothetical protein
MNMTQRVSAIVAGLGLAMAIGQSSAQGQGAAPASQEAAAPQPAIGTTQITSRSHSVGAGVSAGNLDGTACPANFTMLSGACHPGYNDRMAIINQFPNKAGNTWRCGFKNNTGSAASIWVYTLCGQSGGLGSVVNHALQVRRFTTTPLTDAEATSILGNATTVLQTNDGAGDVACAVQMSRSGGVTVFADGDGSIDSAAEFNALIGLPGHIKAVNQINWCGGLIPNVIGCAPVPGNSLAIVRFTASLEGILWAHEFGHNKGLGHRNDDANAVMNGTITSTRRRVTAAECTSFRAQPAVTLVAATVMPQERPAPPMDVREFVRQIFIHGVPFEEASRYGADAVPVLVEMLNDPAEQPYWANIVVVLGMTGEPEAVDPLIEFIEAGEAAGLSREHYTAKTSALMALGYIINATGDEQALDYLRASVNPETWAAKDVGVAPYQTSLVERDYDLSKFAILGLALSGHPEALEILRSLQQPAETEAQRAFQAQVTDVLSGALEEHRKVSEEGLAEYYRSSEP